MLANPWEANMYVTGNMFYERRKHEEACFAPCLQTVLAYASTIRSNLDLVQPREYHDEQREMMSKQGMEGMHSKGSVVLITARGRVAMALDIDAGN
jgi:hypothetical protein